MPRISCVYLYRVAAALVYLITSILITRRKKGDQFFEDRGVRFALDMKSFLYLAGTELDFSDGLNGKGFNFHNPNATRTCGCGESFSV
jgi:iron-sulfur cluster assembly accessory protein